MSNEKLPENRFPVLRGNNLPSSNQNSKDKDITLKKLEVANEVISIFNNLVDIVKLKSSAEAEAYLIREKTRSIEALTKSYIERIKAEGGEMVNRAKIINELLEQLTKMMNQTDMDQETKRELIRTIPTIIQSAL